MNVTVELTTQQQQAWELIQKRGEITQSELWKTLDANSRAGSRLATALAEKGLIERTETMRNGRRTYLLTLTTDQATDRNQTIEDTSTQESNSEESQPSQSTPTEDAQSRREQALQLIQDRGSMYQSALWKELDVSSRTGSRIASQLEEKGEIRREETVHNGNRTYLLRPAKKELDFSLLMAGDMLSPLVGDEEELDPVESNEFTEWVLRLAQNQ